MREAARVLWNDGPEDQREAIEAYRMAASLFAEPRTNSGWQEEDATLMELAERYREIGNQRERLSTLLGVSTAWRERSKAMGDAADQRAKELDRLAGLEPETTEVSPDLDRTQGRGAELLPDLISQFETEDKSEKREVSRLFMNLVGWPSGAHRLDADQRTAMSRLIHWSSVDTGRLAKVALRDDDFFLMQVIDAVGHRPLAPLLAEALRGAQRSPGGFGTAAAEAFRMVMDEDRALAAKLLPVAFALTWDQSSRFVVGKAASLLPPDEHLAFCRDLVTASQGENRGILSHLVNILARDPRNLPKAELRRLVDQAQWKGDCAEVLWALVVLGDESLGEVIPRLSASENRVLLTRLVALEYAVYLRLQAISPVIAQTLANHDPDAELLQPQALIGAVALELPIDEAQLLAWMHEDWGAEPDPATLALAGPWQRYRILSAAAARWLTSEDQGAWAVLARGVAHPWRRYRCHLIDDLGLSHHPRAAGALLKIMDLDDFLSSKEEKTRSEQYEYYLRAFSRLTLSDEERMAAEGRLGQPIPARMPPRSPNFNELTRPCDGGPSAPIRIFSVGGEKSKP